MATTYFPRSEYETRWQRVHAAMTQRGFSTAVVWGRSAGTYDRCGDVLYLTNYFSTLSGQGFDTPMTNARGFSAVVLRENEEPELIADDAWPRRDLIPTASITASHNTISAVIRSLERSGTQGRVALVGSDFFPLKYWQQLQAATPAIEWSHADDLVLEIRRIKSVRELNAVREAGMIADRALDRLMRALLGGRTEAEAAGEAAREVFRAGGHIHMIPISHGPMIGHFASDPLSGYSHQVVAPGELARGWAYGPMFQGYWLDPGRTAVRGRASAAQRELIEGVVGIVKTIMAAMRPGAALADLAHLGDRLTAEFGGDQDQASDNWPSYGHGCGLTFEKDQISLRMGEPGDILEEGMVMGVEAFLGRQGVGSAGFEQNLIVTETGTELVTTGPEMYD